MIMIMMVIDEHNNIITGSWYNAWHLLCVYRDCNGKRSRRFL